MKRKVMLSVVAGLVVLICSAASADRGEGTYNMKQKLPNSYGGGEVNYTLKLMPDGRAELDSSTSGRVKVTGSSRLDYGEILSYLSDGAKIIQRGEWYTEDDDHYVTLTKLDDGSMVDRFRKRLSGRLSGNVVTFDDYDRDFYGSETQMTFRAPSGGGSKKEIVAGIALLTLGALLSKHHDSAPSSSSIRELDLDSGGYGRLRYADDAMDVRKVRIRLYPTGKFELAVAVGSDRFVFTGKWNERKPGVVALDVDGGFGAEGATGTGELTLRNNNKEFSAVSLSGKSRMRGKPYTLDFSSAKG